MKYYFISINITTCNFKSWKTHWCFVQKKMQPNEFYAHSPHSRCDPQPSVCPLETFWKLVHGLKLFSVIGPNYYTEHEKSNECMSVQIWLYVQFLLTKRSITARKWAQYQHGGKRKTLSCHSTLNYQKSDQTSRVPVFVSVILCHICIKMVQFLN